MPKPLPDAARVGPLRTADEARAFVRALHDADMSFHCDDSAEDLVNLQTGESVFLPEDWPLVEARRREMNAMADFDPNAYLLALDS